MYKKSLEYITFKQFIYTINLRDIKYGKYNGEEIYDTQVIKIYFDEFKDWIELGWYDFTAKNSILECLEKFLNKNILESYIRDIKYDDEAEILTVWLIKDISESLEDYQN